MSSTHSLKSIFALEIYDFGVFGSLDIRVYVFLFTWRTFPLT